MEPDWSTPEGLAAIKDALAATIDGWQPPVAYAVGISPRRRRPSWSSRTSTPRAGPTAARRRPGQAAGHVSGSQTYELTRPQLEAAVETLRPAEACTTLEHPNLAAWRTVLAELDANPARTAYAVFVGDLDDPVSPRPTPPCAPCSEARATGR